MSIVIRLQNLPINAKTADVRNFFGGLRIPSGGVHLLGGDKGDAFIAFNSDEDARLAMRKDGGKIKDSRVKLYLSSRMEMQYEVEKITRDSLGETSQNMLSPERSCLDGLKNRPSERRHSRSRSPDVPVWGNDRQRNSSRRIERSRSPVGFRSRSPSPRRRLRLSRRSSSPNSKPFFQGDRPISAEIPGYSHFPLEGDSKVIEQSLDSPYNWVNKECNNSLKPGPSTTELQAQLERRITEEIEKNSVLMSRSSMEYQESVPNMDAPYINMKMPPGHYQPFPMVQTDLSFPPPPLPPFLNNEQHYHEQGLPQSIPGYHEHGLPPPVPGYHEHGLPPPIPSYHEHGLPTQVPGSHLGPFMNEIVRPRMADGFYVTISGLDPLWNFREVQLILKGIYAPQSNIQWEIDDTGRKTGTAFIKLSNRDDFENISRKSTFFFNDRRLTVSECPQFLIHQYFHDGTDEHLHKNISRDLLYMLKGLPFGCSYEDVLEFFHGYEVYDVVILHGRDHRPTGTGYVCFANMRDFEAAYSLNGQKIGHRYIEMLPSNEREMAKGKRLNPNSHIFTSYSKLIAERNLPSTRRPLCAIITGLPDYTSEKDISDFFTESGFKSDAIHITLNKRKRCDGRAFVEFTNFRDFDLALKLHGTVFLKDIIICVKQILYHEMVKILDTQKALHHFKTPVPLEPAFVNMPEKVPYLWEPPDSAEEKEKTNNNSRPRQNVLPRQKNFNPTRMQKKNFKRQVNLLAGEQEYANNIVCVEDPNLSQQNNFNAIRMLHDFKQVANQFTKEQISEKIKFGPKDCRSIDSRMHQIFLQPVNRNTFRQRTLTNIPSHKGPISIKSEPTVKKVLDDSVRQRFPPHKASNNLFNKSEKSPPVDSTREPIKFNVNKSLSINTKTSENFEPAENPDKKIKLSKLSPLKEVQQSSHFKDSQSKDSDFKKKLPEGKQEFVHKERKDSQEDKNFKSKSNKNPISLEGKQEFMHKERKDSQEDKNVKSKSNNSISLEVKPEFMHKERKDSQEDKNVKSKSNNNSISLEVKPEFIRKERKNSQEDKNLKSKSNDSFSRTRERDSRKTYEKKADIRRRSPRRISPPRHSECVVQLSNVCPSVLTQDLVHFLHGLGYNKESIIRRYTNEGEPTGDVRVTFINRKEAELAIRLLNGSYLKEIRINMFVV